MPTKNSLTDNLAFVTPTLTNTKGLLTLLKNIDNFYPKSTVVLINNDGNKPLEEKIDTRRFSMKIVTINNRKNEGYGKAANDGARQALMVVKNLEYLVFLNDDISFKNEWISKCIQRLKKNKWSAAVPVLLNKEGQPENFGYHILPYGKIRPIIDSSSTSDVDGFSAAALIIKSGDFFKLRGYDPIYFAYLEDVDLFIRAKKEGIKFGMIKEVRIFHEGQKTSSEFKVKKAYLDFRNWIILIVKNWGFRKILFNLPSIFIERLRNLWGIVKTI